MSASPTSNQARAVNFLQSGIGAVISSVQAKTRRILDVFDFIPTALHSGIEDGSNATDLSTYIQLAIDEAIDSKRRLDLGPYALDVENTLEVQLTSNIEIFGHGYSGGTSGACKFVWNGVNGGTVLLLDRVRDSEFLGFAIQAGTGTIGVGLDIDGIGTLTVVPSNCIFRKIQVNASTTAIRIANSSTSNNEFHRFYDVNIVGAGTNGYLINNGQSKAHKMYNGSISSRTNGINVAAGSFKAYDLNFNDNDNDLFFNSPSDAITLINPTSENSSRFVDDSGQASAPFALTVQGGRVIPNGVHADGIFFRYRRGGPINLTGVDFAGGTAYPTVKFSITGANDGPTLNHIGCVFPNATPFHHSVTSDRNTIYGMGSVYVDAGSSRPLPSTGVETCVADGANSNIGPYVRLLDDFLGDVIADQWNTQVGTDPQCVAAAVNPGQVGGEIRMTTGDDAAADMATNGTQLDSGLNWKADRKRLVLEARLRISAITNVAVFFGFTDQVAALEMPFTLGASNALTSNATDAVGVLFDTGADTDNWWLVGVKADVDATAQNAAVAPVATRWETWRIEIIDDSGVYFYRNGVLIGSKMTNALTESVLLTPVVAAFSRGAASRNIDVDYINVQSAR